MGFRYSDNDPVFFNNDGTVCAGGSLTYSRTGTSTAHNVYTDSGLGTSLGNIITLDSSGRATDHWLDASTYAYRVVLKNSVGVAQYTRNDVRGVDAAAVSVPDPGDGDDGQVLFTDGVDFYFDDIREVPDPTSHSGKVLGTDGEALIWQELESETFDEDNLPGGVEETTDGSSVLIGHTRIICGTGTCPTASSTVISTVAITFPAGSFSAAPKVVCTPTTTDVTNNSPGDDASISATSITASGFTARAFCGGENNAGTISIDAAITFNYIAMGVAA